MRRMLTLALVAAVAAMAVPPSALAADCSGGDVRPALDNLRQIADTTLCLINAQRTQAGLAPVAEQAQLTAASAAFSQLMVSEHFFAHVSPDGSQLTDRLTASGYLGHPGAWKVGENIAWGESFLATPNEIVKAWMNSPPHRANILTADYSEIGLGIAIGTPSTSSPGATYTTDFGRRSFQEPASDAAAGEITVGDVAPASTTAGSQPGAGNAAAGGGRGVVKRPARPHRKAAVARRGSGCRRSVRARASRRTRRAAGRRAIRCSGAWRAVRSSL